MDMINEADNVEIDLAFLEAKLDVDRKKLETLQLYNSEVPPQAFPPYQSRLWEEPNILKLGGETVGQRINDVLGSLEDYDARALFRTVFTKRNFQYFYKMARGDYGKRGVPGPAWAIQCLIGLQACNDPVLRCLINDSASYRLKTMRCIDEVRRVDRGLAVLVSLEAKPTDVFYIGKSRIMKLRDAIGKHPTARYVLAAVAELAEINLEIYVKKQQLAFMNHPEQHKMWRPFSNDPLLVTRRNQLHAAMKKATEEGDYLWFRLAYDNTLRDLRYGEEMEDWNIVDPTGLPQCAYCNLAHNDIPAKSAFPEFMHSF